jgi:hypothetical protein
MKVKSRAANKFAVFDWGAGQNKRRWMIDTNKGGDCFRFE